MTNEEIINKLLFILDQIMTLDERVSKLEEAEPEKAEPEETIDYEVSWSDAPEWALAHAYDECGEGFWYGPHHNSASKRFASYENSGWQIGEAVMEIHKKSWKNSITQKALMF